MVVGGNSGSSTADIRVNPLCSQARPQQLQPAEENHFLIAHRMKAYVLPAPGTGSASLPRLAAYPLAERDKDDTGFGSGDERG
jgi:hypothetical protein